MVKPLVHAVCVVLAIAAAMTAGIARAQPASEQDACFALMDARRNLVDMLITSDKAALDELREKVHASSIRLDHILMGMRMNEDEATVRKADDFKTVWEAFRNTRETTIIPALYAGKADEAKAIANGIQAERVRQMKATMGCQ